MKRIKTKKKKSVYEKPPESVIDVVLNSNYVALACTIRTLKFEFGFGEKRIRRFAESYAALVEELSDGRLGPRGAVRECKQLTGFDAKELIDEVYGKRGILR